MPQTFVYCTTQFEGFHRWDNATSNVKFLKNLHRHIFHVKVAVLANHNDRDVEFIGLKRNVNSAIYSHEFPETFSCEQIAIEIRNRLQAASDITVKVVEVSEDGENGAIVSW